MASVWAAFIDRRRDWFIPLVILLLVGILAARSPLDPDLWWHLRAGQTSVTTLQPVIADTFSFTRAGMPWINHSWLSEVILYLAYAGLGYAGLELWVVLGAVFSMALIYPQLSGSPILRAFLIVLGSAVCAVVWSPRPQMVSLVFFAGLGTLLFLYKYKKRSQLWVLPILFALWGNLHGGYALGFLLIGAMLAGEVLNHIVRSQRAEVLTWKELSRLVMWSGISALALLVNPNGFDIWKIPFQTVEVGALQQFIQEWASPDFHDLVQQPFLWLLMALILGAGLAGRRVDGTDLVTVILFAAMGLVARRNFGPFGLAALPVLSRCLRDAWRAWQSGEEQALREPGAEEPPPRRRPRWQQRVNLGIVALLGLVLVGKLAATSYPAFMEANIQSGNPSGAVAWLKEHRPAGRMLSEYNWGGYLVWTLPEYPDFVDGRTDLFGDELIGQWIQVVQASPGWEQILARWQIRLVLIDPARPANQALQDAGWQIVYQDAVCVLYTSEATAQ